MKPSSPCGGGRRSRGAARQQAHDHGRRGEERARRQADVGDALLDRRAENA